MKRFRKSLLLQKQRPCTRNLLSQKYSRTREYLPIRTKINCDTKGRSLRWDCPKLQRNNEKFDRTSCLQKNTFGSLESFFDVKKLLELRSAYLLAFDCHKDDQVKIKSAKEESVGASNIKSEPFVETLFLQSLSSQTNLKSRIITPNSKQNTKDELKAYKGLQTTISNPAQYYVTNMTENEGDAWPQEQKEAELINEDAVINEIPDATINDRTETKVEEKDEEEVVVGDENDMREREDESEDKKKIGEDMIDREDKIDGEGEDADGDDIEELKVMNEKCITLANQIQQVKQEVQEIAEKPELTEEDTLAVKEKQNLLMSKLAELDQLTLQTQKIAKKHEERILEESLDIPIKCPEEEKIEKEVEKIKKDIELPKRIVEKARDLDLQLPKIIICNHMKDELPKIVIADKQKEREKHLEKLTGKLTESLTMQERLVQENAQLEGGKYKLEETLLEKDTAIDNLERKVCGLQAEIRMIVKENTELSHQLVTLNQLATSPTCHCTNSDVIRPPPSMLMSLPPLSYSTTPHRENVSCQSSPRLSGGGSKTEDRYSAENMLQNIETCSQSPALAKTQFLRGICPAELRDKFAIHGNSTKQLEQQLGNMECEVHNMQMELANVQRERQQLEQQRKLLKCTNPCAPCPCCPLPPSTCVTPSPTLPLTSTAPGATVSPAKVTTQTTSPMYFDSSYASVPTGVSAYAQQQLRDLREQYARLQEDYKNKLCEVSCMRTDAEKMKQDTRDIKEEKEHMEIKMIDAQERLKLLEAEREKFEGHKERLVEQEQALLVTKQRIRETHDELEDLRSLSQDLSSQLEDYRNKYLQAQQQVEEQRRQLDLMELDNARINENVTLEIGRVKNQFQEKLAELAPLPEILKHSQTKLQEAQQMRLVTERNCENLSQELLGCKDKIQNLQNELNALRAERQALQNEKGHGFDRFEEIEKKCSELQHENERMKNTLARLEEHKAQLQKRADEKMHENMQLSSMLEQVREDSARQVARTKERCETTRWSMQCQIAEMERQLAQCRATARAAQRDRDEIRQKMQSQINNLNEAFEHAQGRIRSLQGHVNYLKTSYSNIFIGQGETPSIPPEDVPGMGHDVCDCIY